jgi:hypothetical protein
MAVPELLVRMRSKPAGDWRIEHVRTLCRQCGLQCSPPSGGGSHYKVSAPGIPDILTIPARRPIKPVYIRLLAKLAARVLEQRDDDESE